MLELIVAKFGGSVLQTVGDIVKSEEIINHDPRRKVIVYSQIGAKESRSGKKLTDQLINIATDEEHLKEKGVSAQDSYNFTKNKYLEIEKGLGIEYGFVKELFRELEQRLNASYKTKDMKTAAIAAWGEWATTKLIVEHMSKIMGIHAVFVDPKDIGMIGEGDFMNAKLLPESYENIRRELPKYFKDGKKAVVPGYYLYDKDGNRMIFSRGGSDLTGAIIAAALNAVEYENFGDKPGVLAADPRIVENPIKIPQITFREMRDLSYSGFGILHPDASAVVSRERIPVHIRSPANYPEEGTLIVHERFCDPEKPVTGIAYENGFCSFSVDIYGMHEEVGFLRRVLEVFENEGISIEYVPVATDDISVVLRQSRLKILEKKIKDPIGYITKKLESVAGGEAIFQDNLGSLVVAGKGLKGHIGISGKVQKTLADAGVNIKFISQGAQERSIIYGINSLDGLKAVNAIYNEYIKPKSMISPHL